MNSDDYLLIQATAVAIEGRALLLIGEPGRGKSSLALKLIDRGATLIGDDGVQLERRDDGVFASPPPNIPGKLEIRGVGIVEMPVTSALVSLILDLDRVAERLPDTLEATDLVGVPIPTLPFDAKAGAASLRAEWALSRFGI